MPLHKNIVTSSPNSCSSNDQEKIVLRSFKVKPVGQGGTKNTLVENDSLSSYSWPEETSRQNEAIRQAGAHEEATRDGDEKQSPANPKAPLSKGDTIIEIDNVQDAWLQEPSYVEAFMRFMYWTCVSPYHPLKTIEGSTSKSRFDLLFDLAQKICFVIITVLSLIQSFIQIKFAFLDNLYDGNLETFIDMSFFFMNMATKIYFVYLFVMQQSKFDRLLSGLGKLRAFRTKKMTTSNKRESSMKYALILGTSSFVVTLIQIIWSVGITKWTPEKTILYHSKQMGKALFIWKAEHLNDTYREPLQEHYGNELTATKLFLGVFRMVMYFCSAMQMDAVTNLMLTDAEMLKQEMSFLEKKISDPNNDTENTTLTAFLNDDGDWSHLQLVRRTVTDNNDAFDPLMKYKHVNNLMLFVFFVLNAFDGEFSSLYLVRLTFNIARTSYTYRIATQAASLNDAEVKWIRRLAWKTKDKDFLERVPLLLHELEREPLGMGKGQFMIDESFLYRFIGSVGSVFVLQAQSREQCPE